MFAADEVVKADPCALEFVDPSDGGHDAKVPDDWVLDAYLTCRVGVNKGLVACLHDLCWRPWPWSILRFITLHGISAVKTPAPEKQVPECDDYSRAAWNLAQSCRASLSCPLRVLFFRHARAYS